MRYLLLSSLFFIFIIGCSQKAERSAETETTSDDSAAYHLDDLAWILGKWKLEEAGSATTFEEWHQTDAQTLEGSSYMTMDNEIKMLETLKIEQRNKEIYYIATVPQNRAPVSFKLTTLTPNRAVFENPTHDFPQKISYQHHTDGSLQAQIEGQGPDGDIRQAVFRYSSVD